MKIRDLFLYFVAVGIALFGLIIVIGAFMSVDQGEDLATAIAMGLGLGVAPLMFGAWLGRYTRRSSRRRDREGLERRVLELAALSQGRLTPVQVAQATHLTLEESKAFLDGLHIDGHCRTDLGDDGSLSYRFDP